MAYLIALRSAAATSYWNVRFVLLLFLFCSAIIEHTNRVIFLEDDDIAAVTDGKLSIHRLERSASDDPSRVIQTLQMELQQIMKGELKHVNGCPNCLCNCNNFQITDRMYI